jgi:hypothetical protein
MMIYQAGIASCTLQIIYSFVAVSFWHAQILLFHIRKSLYILKSFRAVENYLVM